MRDPAARGLRARQAPRHGLRDDHRPRHDRRRAGARRPARHLHLRRADGELPRRAAGRARAVLRDRRRTTTSGFRPTPATSRRAPSTSTRAASSARWRTRSSPSAAPLRSRHRRRLAELFPIWETRNGSRARELNMPAAIYVETQGGIAIGGSDDHAGIDIGRTFTRDSGRGEPGGVPRARAGRPRRPRRRAGQRREVGARRDGAGGPRSRPRRRAGGARPGPRARDGRARCWREGDRREGSAVGNLAPADARALLRAWLASVDLDDLSEADLVAYMQDERFTPRRPATAARRAPTSGSCARRSPSRSTPSGAARSRRSAPCCSRPAFRRSRTRRRPRSSRANARSSRASDGEHARESRSSPTASGRCTA